MQCIRDFLLRLPDPRAVQQQVNALYDTLEGGYRPSIVALREALEDTQVMENFHGNHDNKKSMNAQP